MSKVIVDLNDDKDINGIARTVKALKGLPEKVVIPINKAVEVLTNFTHEIHLNAAHLAKLNTLLQIRDDMSPSKMNQCIRASEHASIVERRYINAEMSEKQFHIVLTNIVSHFASIVSIDVLNAIIDLITNFSKLCFSLKATNQVYSDLCYRFFAPDAQSKDIMVLVLNLSYKDKTKHAKCFDFFVCSSKKINFEFFSALVTTDIDVIQNESA